MNTLFRLITGITAITLIFSACEKEEVVLSGIPSLPTAFFPENGTVIPEYTVKLSAGGSSAENGRPVSYEYYLGTDPDNLKHVNWITNNLAKGTQYFWQVIPFTYNNDTKDRIKIPGKPSPIYTFYTIPEPLEGLESDNGETETQVILRWDEPANCKHVEITFSPTSNDVAQPIIVPAGQDSCVISGLLDFRSETHSFIKYTFTIKATVLIGDKEMERDAQIDEIPLNKTKNVRDADYNVYTCLRIGNQIWLRENLRTTRLNDGRDLIKDDHYFIGSRSNIYGLYYDNSVLFDNIFSTHSRKWTSYGPQDLAPKGFKVAMMDDWMQLFKSLGLADDDAIWHELYKDEYLFDDAAVAYKLKSDTGWPVIDGINGNGYNSYTFSVLPGGYINPKTGEELGVGQVAWIYAANFISKGAYDYAFRFEPTAKGVYKYMDVWNTMTSNIRCVKNVD